MGPLFPAPLFPHHYSEHHNYRTTITDSTSITPSIIIFLSEHRFVRIFIIY